VSLKFDGPTYGGTAKEDLVLCDRIMEDLVLCDRIILVKKP
jgi:hypothetical protein